jgi:hypothetical protein
LLFEHVHEEELQALHKVDGAATSALCLSGGGVRSASFSLGVLQALSRAGVLDRFDYLSTVSGGGYVGGWLSAWRLRAKEKSQPDPCLGLDDLSPDGKEPHPLRRLRAYIKYLTPHTGILSADVWTLIGTMLRNLFVNWMLLIPIIGAAAMLPGLYLGVLGLPSQPELISREALESWCDTDWILMSVLIAIAGTYAALQLPSLGRRPYGLRGFLGWFLVPVLLVHVLLSVHRSWSTQFDHEPALLPQMLFGAGGMVLPWIVGGIISGRFWQPSIWLAAATAGAVGRFAGFKAHGIAMVLAENHPHLFAVLDLTTTLGMFFVQISLFIGLASRAMTDEDREWWARTGAWILICAVAWGAVSTVAILGPLALRWGVDYMSLSPVGGRVGLGVLTVMAGIAQRASAAWALVSANSSRFKPLIATLAAPLITVSLFVLMSDANDAMLNIVHSWHLFPEHSHPLEASLPEDLIIFGFLALVSIVLGQVIAVNRFSLHGMYRSRLARTFLGASRPTAERHPSPFTGFDAQDDLPMSALASNARPLHIVNATINTVDDQRLANTERLAQSFTFSALHSGAASVGYRPSSEYAGGVTLGDAITTSGAAVNSNMGAEASGAQTFLLTVFNARLGVWLGNPGKPGAKSWTKPLPSFGVGPLLNELLARTTDTNPYVNLSDGGHFDNLGVYEMIRRRCQAIVAIDAGADPAFAFGDLANLIRKVRVDFGVSITFPNGLPIGPSSTGDERTRWGVGIIDYKSADRTAKNGVLLYIKPTILGDEPIDVANYAHSNPPFPHQPTTNQWFDSAEFESYRALGWHTVVSLTGGRTFAHPGELIEAAIAAPGAES